MGSGSSAAGAVIGLAVGLFLDKPPDSTLFLMSLLFGTVVGLTVFVCSVALYPVLRNLSPWVRWGLLVVGLLAGSAAGTAAVVWRFLFFVLSDTRQALAVFTLNAVLALVVGRVGARLRRACAGVSPSRCGRSRRFGWSKRSSTSRRPRPSSPRSRLASTLISSSTR